MISIVRRIILFMMADAFLFIRGSIFVEWLNKQWDVSIQSCLLRCIDEFLNIIWYTNLICLLLFWNINTTFAKICGTMGTTLEKLREYLRTASREDLDAKYNELSEFLSIGPVATVYLDTLPPAKFESSEYNSTVDPEYSLDFLFLTPSYNDTCCLFS